MRSLLITSLDVYAAEHAGRGQKRHFPALTVFASPFTASQSNKNRPVAALILASDC